jgi:hypothetical protein
MAKPHYVGLDFNPAFIEALRAGYPNDHRRDFRVHDLETSPPEDLRSQAHLVLNFFNLFELPQLSLYLTPAAKYGICSGLRFGGS